MMKSLWNSFKIAFAMFSKIPMPQADWSEENFRLSVQLSGWSCLAWNGSAVILE